MTDKKPRTFRRMFVERFFHDRLAIIGAVIVAVLFVVALSAPFIAPYDPELIPDNIKEHLLLPPSWDHPCGTDDRGRDIFSRMIYGSRISLLVGFVAVGIAVFIGLMIGAVAGYFGGWVDEVLMRFVDLMLTIPTFFLILAVMAFRGPGIYNIMVVIGLTGWMSVARLVRAEFLALKERDFVMAARALGVPDFFIIFRHILPNAMAPVLVSATLGVAGAILTESALSYLGFGVRPPTPSWGNILMEGKATIEVAWWQSTFPGLAILVTVMGYNLLGEGIRDALDPRLH